MQVKLTEARVKKLQADRRRVVWDTEVTGLGLRVSPSGGRSWIVKYRMPGGGRQRKLTLGAWPEIKVGTARDMAREVLRDRGMGKDPAVERRRAAQALTLREVFEDFMREIEDKRAAATLKEYRGSFQRYVLPAMGSRTCAEIRFQDVAALHRRIGQRAPSYANTVVKCMGRVFDHATRIGAFPAELRNPARGVEKFPQRVDTGRALTPEELRAVWEALGDGRQADAVRVTLLSGLRPSEVRLLRWKEVGEGGRVLRLAETKTGARVAHVGPRAGEIITAQPELSEYVFTGQRGGRPFYSLREAWDAARDAAGIEARLYDLRHTFASVAGERVELTEDRIGRLLGHSVAAQSMTRRYSHRSTPAVLRDAERVESALWELLTGEEPAGGEVVELRTVAGGA